MSGTIPALALKVLHFKDFSLPGLGWVESPPGPVLRLPISSLSHTGEGVGGNSVSEDVEGLPPISGRSTAILVCQLLIGQELSVLCVLGNERKTLIFSELFVT